MFSKLREALRKHKYGSIVAWTDRGEEGEAYVKFFEELYAKYQSQEIRNLKCKISNDELVPAIAKAIEKMSRGKFMSVDLIPDDTFTRTEL